ncbi:MAG TPA: winged helix-turn-helix transcriptional regulator, partial [Verrucomicrobiota bacterium]|nr:winged helix-turn-helix transcriptional regulator [Verrucomicrobiota bacterium]
MTCGSLAERRWGIARRAVIVLGLSTNAVLFAATDPGAPPQIPVLRWEERSDWVNVKTDVAPAAVGDGQADDTVAIQKALANVRDGSVLYFPPGTYRFTAPLVLRNATGARWIGGLIVGNGRETKWFWDGARGGTMLLLDGVAYSRFIGLELDGRGSAAVGFQYQATQGFQTEVNAPACPIRNVLDQVGNKWSLLVLMSLQGRRRRFMEVKRSIGDITQRVLTQTLRRLERDGHVSRQVYPTSPPTVEYRLTPTGESLLKPMGKLVRWANVHFGEVAVR